MVLLYVISSVISNLNLIYFRGDDDDKQGNRTMILAWQKLDVSGGFNPAFREGHSAGSHDDLMILFGGFEAGRRVNSSLILDVRYSRWSHAPCAGDLPAPRSLHASCTIGSFYLIHGGETSRDNLNTSVSAQVSPINQKNDICPGDSISIAGSKNKNPGIIDTANLCTLDDLYALEWEVSPSFKKEGVRIWRKIPCQLAPLPRCGHTLTLCNIQGKSSCVLLGGYSRETNTASSSIHLFYTDDFKKMTEDHLSDKESIKNHTKRKASPYLTWRTLECSGQGSGPRHKHSATLLSGGSDGSSFIAVFGGIGSNGNVLHDLHLLDLDNLTWSSISTHNAANKPIGTFFHSAMSVPRIESDNEQSIEESKSEVLIIFGGSTNVSDSSSACVPGIRCYDPITHEWSKVKTAYLYPSGRYGQSTTVVDGYSPAHTLPNNSGNVPFPESSILGDEDRGRCAVIFGGSNAIMQCAETWVLDLKWRPNGVQQFDHTHDKRTDYMLKSQLIEVEDLAKSNNLNTEENNMDTTKQTFLSKSSSVPSLMRNSSTLGHTVSNLSLTQDSKLAESAFHKVRRERAQASLLLQRERERAMRAEDREQKLLLEIGALHQQIKDIRENHEKESSQLRKELEKSVSKEAKYRALNEEAYQLLLLHGIDSINQ